MLFTFDYAALAFQVDANLSTVLGSYTVTVEVSMVNYALVSQSTGFLITVLDPCIGTNLFTNQSFANLTITAGTGIPTSYPFLGFTDTVAIQTGNTSYCGALTYIKSISAI